MDELLVEVLDEAIGTSPKKWALIVVALLAGAIVALWLTRRRRQADLSSLRPRTPRPDTHVRISVSG